MDSIDKRASSGYEEPANKVVDLEEDISFEDIMKDETLFFMMYVPKTASATGFVLFTDEDGQPILVVEKTSKEIASKIAKKFMLLRPASELFKQKE